MPVPVMDVRPVRVTVGDFRMFVQVGMVSQRIRRRRILTVRVVVVGVIMPVAVLMDLRSVRMFMDMLFGNQEVGTCNHEEERGHKEKRGDFRKQQECKNQAEKRGKREN